MLILVNMIQVGCISGLIYVNMRLSNGIPCYWLIRLISIIRMFQWPYIKHIQKESDAPKNLMIGLYPMISPSNPHKIPVKSPENFWR